MEHREWVQDNIARRESVPASSLLYIEDKDWLMRRPKV